MLLTTRVKLVLAETPTVGLPNVKVALFDQDIDDEDDPLGTGVTDAQGEFLFAYDSSLYTDAEDKDDWTIASLPDLYVIAYDAQGQEVVNTREQTRRDKLPKLLTVPVSRALAEAHGLLAG